MAKKETTAKADDKLILETMPGADPISDADAAPFEVDLNFDTPEEEVEFPKEDEIEEISETELTTTPEEMEAQAGQQEETADIAEGEVATEERLDAESEGDTQQPIPTDKRENDEPVVETKAPMVPKSRLDEVLAKQKALQKQLDESNAAKQEVLENLPEYDFTAKELEYQNLVLDGEAEKAVELRGQIRNAEKEQFMFEVQAKMGQTVKQNNEQTDLEAKAVELQTAFPQLDENSATYNSELTQEVMDLRDAFIIQGFTGADALDKAAKYIVTPTQATKTAVNTVKQVQQQQQTSNISKKLQAADSQPPAMSGEGAGAKTDKKIDLNVLSTDEFDALPAETLRRMRGDFG
tara:strand:- start:267 stop:1319 length:1053 start_codon:yes stop_codon:yes gene_type:complete